MTTFGELAAHFPLFEAPIDDASRVADAGLCSLCGKESQIRFELGIGCDVMVTCPGCGIACGLDADDAEAGRCRGCGHDIPFPLADDDGIYCCYACLRAGRAAITKDTELGMLTWEQAVTGVSHGMPELAHPDFEMVRHEGGWVGARLPVDAILELLRTPNYSTIQGDRWLFCCKQPMVFLGQWSRDRFNEMAADGNGRALFEDVVDDTVAGLWEDALHDDTGVYVFRCAGCSRMRAHWDIA